MSGGGSVWYQMRPNKFVDRSLFVECLGISVSAVGAHKYVYASMGASHLVDHHAVYQRLGIRSLFSFDQNQISLERQLVNRPIDTCICQKMDSKELPDHLSTLLDLFDDASNVAVWLDYTSAERFQQLSEFENVLGECAPGDVCRITMNSDVRNIGGLGDRWKRDKFKSPGAFRADRLRTGLGHYFESSFKEVEEDAIPIVLAHAVRIACSRAELRCQGVTFIPVLITTYKDGQRMFTATVYAAGEGGAPPPIRSWEYLASDWLDVLDIDVPELSTREKILIDNVLSQDAAHILQHLSFVPANDEIIAARSLESYKKLHRFVPAFYHIDVR